MKRPISFWCTVMLATMLRAGNTLTLSSASGHPEDVVSVAATLTNTDAVSALEMNVPLGPNLQYVEGSCSINAARNDGHQLTATVVDDVLKVYVYSMGLKSLKGADGELLTFKLKLGKEPADYPLEPAAVLSSASGHKIESATTAGNITLLSPKIEIATPAIDFGRNPIRSTYTQELTVKNAGNEELRVSDISIDDNRIAILEKTFSVPPGATKEITLSYSPQACESISATATVTSNAVNDIVMLQRQTATISAESYSVNELHLTATSGKSDSTITLSLAMDNMEPIVAMQCEIALPEAMQYVEGSAKVCERAAGHQIMASSTGGTLSLYAYSVNNQPFEGSEGYIAQFDLKLSGASGRYALTPSNVVLANAGSQNMTSAVTGNSVTIEAPQLVADDKLAFGSQSLTGEVTADYAIGNSGTAPLIIDKAVFLSEGYELLTTLPLKVKQGATAKLTVKHSPLAEGDFSTTMQVYSNDPQCRMKSVVVSGHAFEPNRLSFDGHKNPDGSYTLTVSLDNYSQVTALQFLIRGLVYTTIDDNGIAKTARASNHNVTVTDMGGGTYLVLVYSMNNAAIAGNSGKMLSLTFDAAKTTNTTVTIDGIVISTPAGTNKNTSEDTTIEATYGLSGDANKDGRISIADATTTLAHIINPTSASANFNKAAADINQDGAINIDDVTRIIEIIVNK